MSQRHVPVAQRGFTLLEAIVALMLVATVGLAMFSWLNTSLSTLSRVEDNRAKDEATLQSLEFIKLLNPLKQPSGTQDFGGFQMRWASTQRSEKQDIWSEGTGPGDFVVQLFDTDVTLARKGEPTWVQFKVRTVGYDKVRNKQDTIFGVPVR